MSTPSYRRLEALSEDDLGALSEVLVDCVDGGASVSFMAPLSPARARAYWQSVATSVAAGERLLFVVDGDDGRPWCCDDDGLTHYDGLTRYDDGSCYDDGLTRYDESHDDGSYCDGWRRLSCSLRSSNYHPCFFLY